MQEAAGKKMKRAGARKIRNVTVPFISSAARSLHLSIWIRNACAHHMHKCAHLLHTDRGKECACVFV